VSDVRVPRAGDLAGDFLPQTPPFLLLDRVIALDGSTGRFVRGVAAGDPLVTANGELPALLIVEAMAQGSGIVLVHLDPSLRSRSAMLAAIDHCEFTGHVYVGDALEIEVSIVRRYGDMARVRGTARVGDRACATAALTLALAPAPA
jgi:UDP-3-O-[3-hydroxymyristoyl] N-acetylglucosamine deacetylase/3-hydroxyacyl-[acyl-carrier-protein] dehydratase